MGTVNGVGIAVGQVWRTRGGHEARVTSTQAGKMFPVLAVINDVPASYTTTGHWNGEQDQHPRDLVELVSGPAGDAHEALTFGPLDVGAAETCCGKDCVGCGAPMLPNRESVEFNVGDVLPATGVEDDTLGVRRSHAVVEPGAHGTGAFTTRPESIQLAEGEPIPVPEFEGAALSETWAEQDVIDPRFAAAHYGHDLRPVNPGRTNPKDSVGDKKAAMHLLSPIAEAHWMVGQYAGMLKYGAWNWRAAGVRSSVYISAARRHLMAYLSGEEFDPVDGSHHLGNVMACAAILLEAGAIGKLVDDRPPSFSHRPTLAWAEDRMAQLKVQYADKFPRHYTIADTKECFDDAQGGAA